MAGCTLENWTLQDLSNALTDMHKDKKRIVVPMFQRGKRWKKDQENKFIDSLIKGYPVGTMLFYESFEDGKRTYILVDGLQRGNSIKKYMTEPTDFSYDDSISDDLCSKILILIDKKDESNYTILRSILTDFIKEQKTFKNLQLYEVAKRISDRFESGHEPIGKIIEMIKLFFEEKQCLYDKIANTVIPVIVYSGDEGNLPEIFDRINSQGTPLDLYEVYAASWPINQRFQISNSEIIECLVRKYDTFVKENFSIHGYNREEMRSKKEVNAFEYLFGLSKHLVNKYSILAFNKSLSDDSVNPLGFELVNACLNDTDRIKTLYNNLHNIDKNLFEQALYKTIDFVVGSISAVTKFKGNSRYEGKLFHSKYQILSMISTTYKEMYNPGEYTLSPEWSSKKQSLSRNLMMYYVYDIITNYWSEGGTNKIHSAAKPNRYMIQLASRTWMVALDSFFEKSMRRAESKKVASPRSEEFVLLNCIYLNTFTAMDQLSIDKFDVEHIAPKEQMRKLLENCNGEGLPISCIANLCYLPEFVNRSKKDKNFYQDKRYLHNINLKEVESKYSFTESEDLEWMDMPYEKPEDFKVLEEYYTEYCTKRFGKLKHLLCDSLGIEFEEVSIQTEIGQDIVLPIQNESNNGKRVRFADKCVLRLARITGTELIKVGSSSYRTKDGRLGFVISTSKMYSQGDRERYWFAYRKNPLKNIENCEQKYIVYGCKDEQTMLMLPINEIDNRLDSLNISKDEDGEIAHWHIVFFKDKSGNIAWLLSKPHLEEIDITKFELKEK